MNSKVFLGLCAVLCVCQTARAQFVYMVNPDNTVTITGYQFPNGCGFALNIPSNIDGLAVTSIGENAFFGGTCLTSVTIPGCVTGIGYSAFAQSGLTNVTLGYGLVSVGVHAFYMTGLTSVTIPGSVTTLDSAFVYCPDLTNVTIANGVTGIGDEAFSVCDSLRHVTIPASVTSIGFESFSGCSSLTAVTIPSGSIGTYAFNACVGVTNVTFGNGVTSIGDGAFVGAPLSGFITIPASVGFIGSGAFSGCRANVFFAGNAPASDDPPFEIFDPDITTYYLPGASGWSYAFFQYPAGPPAVLWNPLFQTSAGSFGIQSNQFGFNVTGTANIPVVVESCTTLTGSVWTPLQTLTLTNGSYYFSEPSQTNLSGRYYRIRSP